MATIADPGTDRYSMAELMAVEITGFHLIVPENVPDTLPPTDEELKLLRTRVDRDAILGKFRLTAG
ncbi:hypothetical protein N9174_01195 [bacterium]|nr:hypothetical protein [bacterium]